MYFPATSFLAVWFRESTQSSVGVSLCLAVPVPETKGTVYLTFGW